MTGPNTKSLRRRVVTRVPWTLVLLLFTNVWCWVLYASGIDEPSAAWVNIPDRDIKVRRSTLPAMPSRLLLVAF